MLKEHAGAAAECIMSSTITTSLVSYRNSAAKLIPTKHVINVFPRLKFLSTMTTFTTIAVYLIKSFTTNKIYLHGARSGFEPEPPVHIRT
jgi:hypothetical protein